MAVARKEKGYCIAFFLQRWKCRGFDAADRIRIFLAVEIDAADAPDVPVCRADEIDRLFRYFPRRRKYLPFEIDRVAIGAGGSGPCGKSPSRRIPVPPGYAGQSAPSSRRWLAAAPAGATELNDGDSTNKR